MLTDPQVVTVNAIAKSMPRITIAGLSAIYALSDESFKLMISHTKSNKRIRSLARIDQRAVVADPLTSENDYELLTVYTVIDRPEVGFSVSAVQELVTGHQDWLTPTIVGMLYGQQS